MNNNTLPNPTHVDKETQLEKLTAEMKNCRRCPLWQNPQAVVGEGNPHTRVFFAGEAPGYYEAQKGRPFVGPAGLLLEELLNSIGLERQEVFISNVLHHRPPQNRDPFPEEVKACQGYLFRQIEIINPRIISTLGRFAMNLFLPTAKISRDHGQKRRVKSRTIFPLYHPAAALRSAVVMEELKRDFQKLKTLLETEHWESEIKDTNLTQTELTKKRIEQIRLF